VRHRLNVQAELPWLRPWHDAVTAPPCWRIFARVIGSPMFLRARVAFARAHLCQEPASGAWAFAGVLRGFERTDRFADKLGYAQAFLLHAAKREMELA
jgi:hypothetical protein